MNPNYLTRALRNLPGNVQDIALPGGSIVSAVMDRDLMTWSDRGGASRIFGEIWSEHCWEIIGNGTGERAAIADATGTETVLRLDANPRIATQAARNKLTNPDFLLISEESDTELRVRAVDAKFAFDRLRRTQISPDALRDLVELPGSLVRETIDAQVSANGDRTLEYGPGAFVGPRSLLNDFYYQRLTTGDEPDIPEAELLLLPVDAAAMYARTEEHPLMVLLEEMDGLGPYTTDTGVLFGMYYLRLACAARWFEEQSQKPLLSLDDQESVPVEHVVNSLRQRLDEGESAYQIIRNWSRSAEAAAAERTQVRNAARLPLRMAELRSMLEHAGLGDDKKRLKILRGSLERTFMRRLVEEVGEIPAQPREPVSTIVQRVQAQSRKLRPDLLKQASATVERFAQETR